MTELGTGFFDGITGTVTVVTAVLAAVVGWSEYRKARARERREVAFEFLRRLRDEPALRLGTIFLDWRKRRVEVLGDYRSVMEGETFIHDEAIMWGALAPSDARSQQDSVRFTWPEVIYRDTFDRLFDFLKEVQMALEQRWVEGEDLKPLVYWLDLLEGRHGESIGVFLRAYHSELALGKLRAAIGVNGDVEGSGVPKANEEEQPARQLETGADLAASPAEEPGTEFAGHLKVRRERAGTDASERRPEAHREEVRGFLGWGRQLLYVLAWVRQLFVPMVAVVFAVVPALLVIFGLPGDAMCRGAYDAGDVGVVIMTVVATGYAIALFEMARVFLVYGPARVGASIGITEPWKNSGVRWATGILAGLVPLATLQASRQAGALANEAVAVAVALSAGLTVAYWNLLYEKAGILLKILESRWFRDLAGDFWKKDILGYTHFKELPDGDQVPDGPGHGHVRLALLQIVLLATIGGILLLPAEFLPAAFYLLVLGIWLASLLSGLAFFLARYRVPLVLVLLPWVFLGGKCHPEYSYRVEKSPDGFRLPKAGDILQGQRLGGQGDAMGKPESAGGRPPRRVLVGAVGGGIHSGAWAVEVLARLQHVPGCEELPEHLALLSGTSGGSYGLMHYAHQVYGAERPPSWKAGKSLHPDACALLSDIRGNARQPSLGSVVRALAYKDVGGYFFPGSPFPMEDRGRALESAWARNGSAGLEKVTLADWANRARRGEMPAVAFTSGTLESGRPAVFASTAVHDWHWNYQKPPSSNGLPPDPLTVRVVTAARLSATFPYVTPVASPEWKGDGLKNPHHQMDGGYYDNYGMVAAIRWLEDALTGELKSLATIEGWSDTRRLTAAQIERIRKHFADCGMDRFLFIQIRYKQDRDPDREKGEENQFVLQSAAPLLGLYSAWVAGQQLRLDEHFHVFSTYWENLGVHIDNATFEFEGESALSWKLTAADQKVLDSQGEGIGLATQSASKSTSCADHSANSASAAMVRRFLERFSGNAGVSSEGGR